MRRRKGNPPLTFTLTVVILAIAVGVARSCRKPAPSRAPAVAFQAKHFSWPAGIKAAVSITFDHSTTSQLDRGVPILDAHGIKASFYLDIPEAKKRIKDWRKVHAEGHEIGNHSLNHPCSGDYRFERMRGGKYALESATLDWIEKDIMAANEELKGIFGEVPRTFSYPCGEMFAGRGGQTMSYVPVVASHFIAGRGFGLDFSNNPRDCDLAKVNALAADGYSFEAFKRAIERAMAAGDWVIFCGHGVGEKGGRYPGISPAELEKLCKWLESQRGVIWTGTVAEVAEYISKTRGSN